MFNNRENNRYCMNADYIESWLKGETSDYDMAFALFKERRSRKSTREADG